MAAAVGPSPILTWSALSLWVRGGDGAPQSMHSSLRGDLAQHVGPQAAGERMSELEVERESERDFLRGVLSQVSR